LINYLNIEARIYRLGGGLIESNSVIELTSSGRELERRELAII